MILIKNIKQLVQVRDQPTGPLKGSQLQELPILENAFLLIEGKLIKDFGKMDQLPEIPENTTLIDATGKLVCPSFVDSHTHLVFAGSRETEFTDRIKGLSYQEIAKKGGGILNSAKRLQQTTEDELFTQSLVRLKEIEGMGTGLVEIKSGYGLTVLDELKILRVIKRLKAETEIGIKSTFLGAHAIPKEYEDRNQYIDLVLNEMIPAVAAENLANYCDVFCDKGFFTPEESDKILKRGMEFGLKPRIHANELANSGGVQVAVANKALSADHLECVGPEELEALKHSGTIPTLLPGTAFFLNIPYPDARAMINADLPVALASDYNPGTCPSGNMMLVLSIACTQLKMTPAEAFNAATINSACALELKNDYGSITKGKVANLFITKPVPSFDFLPYSFGINHIEKVIINGKVQEKRVN